MAVWLRAARAPLAPGLLDAHESARHAALPEPQATAYGRLHTLARLVVGGLGGQPGGSVRFDRTCQQCGEQHGRPVVVGDAGLHVSLSRAGDWVAVAVTRLSPVGVDIEGLDGVGFEGYAGVALHDSERTAVERCDGHRLRRRAVAWVRKESALKALGTGLVVDPTTFAGPTPGAAATIVDGMPPVTVVDLTVDDGHAGAVALAGTRRTLVVDLR